MLKSFHIKAKTKLLGLQKSLEMNIDILNQEQKNLGLHE